MDTASLQTAVSKLNELKSLGIITENEFQQRKAELIDKALASQQGYSQMNAGKGYAARGFGLDTGKGGRLARGKGMKGSQPGYGGAEGHWQDWQGKGLNWQGGGWQQENWQLGWQGQGRGQKFPPQDTSQSRVLLVTFKDSPFPGHDAVAAHFSTIATVEKITHVTKPDREQALVQVATVDEAMNCVRALNHSAAEWCHDIDVQKARVSELTFKTNDSKNKSYVALQPGRVLLLTLTGLQGPFPGLDSLYEMFKIYGAVERMSHITKPDREQCMIQFADPAAAAAALAGLQDWNMGFCVFSLQIARTDSLTFKQSDERNKDFTGQV